MIAIAVSDIHLSHTPPIWRSAEPNWYDAMRRQLDELSDLQKLLDVPILCAGDVFDRWNSPAELINFAIKYLPVMYTVAGQHDLPNHSISEVDRSAFGCLRLCGTLLPASDIPCVAEYNWNDKPPAAGEAVRNRIAVIHRYVWSTDDTKYLGAPKESNARAISRQYKADLVISGDNHKGFYDYKNNVFNCGGFYRRTRDQIDYQPMVGLVYENLKVAPYFMDTDKDLHLEDHELLEVAEVQANLKEFMKDLRGLNPHQVDYRSAVMGYCQKNGISKEAVSILTRIMNNEE